MPPRPATAPAAGWDPMPQRALLLTLLIALGALVGCARDRPAPAEIVRDAMQATRDAVQDAVDDKQRRGQLLEFVDELEGLFLSQTGDLEELSRDLRRIHADPDATRSAFDAEISGYQERRRARRTRAVDLHFAMMDVTRPDEWSRIIRRELDAIEALGRIEGD